MGEVASQIFLQCVHFGPFYVYSIVPRPTTPPIWQMFQVLLLMCIDHMHIRKVSGCSNHGTITFFDVVAAYFWMLLLGMGICYVGQKAMFVFWGQEYGSMVVWGIMTLGSSPIGRRWMTGWYLCTMMVLEPKERLFILLFKVVFKILIFNTQTPLENLWGKNNTNQNYFSQVMMDHQEW